MTFVVTTSSAAWACDTEREVATLLVKHPGAEVRQLRCNPASRDYQAGVRAVRLALARERRNASAALEHLTRDQTYRINGHRVRVVGDDHVVVDGVRMGMALATRKLGAG